MYRAQELLQQHGISARKLAERLKMSKTTVNRLLKNERWPTRVERAVLKAKIAATLRAAGATRAQIAAAWQSISAKPVKTSAKDLMLRRKSMITLEMQKHMGLTRDPFDNELDGPEDVLDTPQTKRVVDRMVDAAKNCKFIAVIGPVGSGKSTAKQLFLHELRRNQKYLVCEPEIISKERCAPVHIVHAMMDDFMYLGTRSRNFKRIFDPKGDFETKSRWVHALLRTKVSDGKKLVLVIDEAHAIPALTLKALKRFHELQDGFKKLIAIILVGQEELHHSLVGNYDLREVSARVNIVEMNHIARSVEDYLEHKISRAGGSLPKIIEPAAVQQIKRLLQKPMPLTINNLAARAISEAYERGMLPVSSQIVEDAYRSFKHLAA